jgi:peptide/nickel transport system permease protein
LGWSALVLAYIIKRVLSGLVVIILVSMSIFALFWFGPRSPAAPLCQQDLNIRCTAAALQRYEERMGFNDNAPHQYWLFVKGVFVGRDMKVGAGTYHCGAPCFGIDYRTKKPVGEEFKEKFPATLSLAIGGAALYFLIGVTVGTLAARKRGTMSDRALVTGTLVMSSIPYYLVCILAYIYFIIVWNLFPQTGYHKITENPWLWFSGLILPWLVLGLYQSTAYTRFSRGSMVETLSEDYIRTARAKGLTARQVVFKHGLRASIVPVVTIFGLDFAFLLAGTVFTEKIFQIEGIGKWGLDATYQRNLPVVSAVVLLGAVVIIASNIIVDIVYSVIDPRVRLT